jgi:hypothetical protein
MYYTTINETEEAVAGLFPAGRVLYYYICIILLLMKQKRQLQGSSLQVGYYTTTYVLYYYICVLILLYMCPQTTIYMSSYYIKQDMTHHKGQFQGSIQHVGGRDVTHWGGGGVLY